MPSQPQKNIISAIAELHRRETNQPCRHPRLRIPESAITSVSEPRKELTRAIGELYKLQTGISVSDAKAAVVNARSVLMTFQGAPLRRATRQRTARREARSIRTIFNAAIDACDKIDSYLGRPALMSERLVPVSHVMQGNLSAIEAYLLELA